MRCRCLACSRRSSVLTSRYDHRLHGVLLVAQGMTCPEVARLLGEAPRSVEYWVHRFQQQGWGGLAEGERSGRPSRLSEKQSKEINRVLRERPSDAGMRVNLWDGKTLSAWIEKTYGIQLGVRQCQRLFRQFEFRLRKPRHCARERASCVAMRSFSSSRTLPLRVCASAG